MNCQNFETIVNDLARQQMMEANSRDQALAHTDECGQCALKLADERALTQKLRQLTSEMGGLEAPGRIEGELLAAFRKQKFIEPRPSANRRRAYWATAIAAAVLLTVVSIVAISMRPRPTQTAAEGTYVPPFRPGIAITTKGPDSLPIDGGQKPMILPGQRNTLASYKPKRRVNSQALRSNSANSAPDKDALVVDSDSTVAANYDNEIATDFMPVGYASPMSLQDGGQVMRVELPRSALAGFGLPVNMDRVNETVKADVLVGTDGQARAIRFVR
jgi:hypothetical protein